MIAGQPGRLAGSTSPDEALHCLDCHHSGDRLYGASDLRGELETPRQLYLHFYALQQQNERNLAVCLILWRTLGRALEPFGHTLDRTFAAQEYAQPLREPGGSLIERLNQLDASAHIVALQFGR